ncbi:MAG: hypothetical protein FWE76_01585, partial [Symbiobacteriaceae bacterium]|nr:hypothetical protein [Symbiobacteriaceae bacterium]
MMDISREMPTSNDLPTPHELHVGLTYNLKHNLSSFPLDAEAEFDDDATIEALQKVLEQNGCRVSLLEATE